MPSLAPVGSSVGLGNVDAKFDAPGLRQIDILFGHAALNFDGAASIPIKRQEPATSAARIATSRHSTCSLLKMHPGGSGKLNVHIAEL